MNNIQINEKQWQKKVHESVSELLKWSLQFDEEIENYGKSIKHLSDLIVNLEISIGDIADEINGEIKEIKNRLEDLEKKEKSYVKIVMSEKE